MKAAPDIRSVNSPSGGLWGLLQAIGLAPANASDLGSRHVSHYGGQSLTAQTRSLQMSLVQWEVLTVDGSQSLRDIRTSQLL